MDANSIGCIIVYNIYPVSLCVMIYKYVMIYNDVMISIRPSVRRDVLWSTNIRLSVRFTCRALS